MHHSMILMGHGNYQNYEITYKTCCFYNILDILSCYSAPKLTIPMFCYYQTLKSIQKVLFDSKAFIC